MEFNNPNLTLLSQLSDQVNEDNVGDVFERSIPIRAALVLPRHRTAADTYMQQIFEHAQQADIGWRIYRDPVTIGRDLTGEEIQQVMALVNTLQELAYSFESISWASELTYVNSVPVRLFQNAIFSYISALFLLDYIKNTKAGFAHPGTTIKLLQPLDLEYLLDPIYHVLNKPFGNTTFREVIRLQRNNQFVHGTFSYNDIRQLVDESKIHEPAQKILFNDLEIRLFEQIVILKLKLISLLSDQGIDLVKLKEDFLAQL